MLKAAPDYIIIRMSKKEQQEKKGHVGHIVIPETIAFMEYNLQAGEIISIGERAHTYFPEAEIGNILIGHHFIESEDVHHARAEGHLIEEDDTYRYYSATCYDVAGRGNETYGIWNGEKIIPNKDFIFLEPKASREALKGFDNEDIIDKVTQTTDGGLIVFKEWKMSREERIEKMNELKKQIEELSKSDPSKPHVKIGILQKEEELEKLSLELNQKMYEPYTVYAFNKQLCQDFNGNLAEGDTMFLLNVACQTHVDFMGSKYIVAKTNYIGFIYQTELEIAS